MTKHISKTYSDSEVKAILEQYIAREITADHVQRLLGIKRRRLFKLLEQYRQDPENFTLQHQRKKPSRQLPIEVYQQIDDELMKERELINDINNPVRYYNFSYVKARLAKQHNIEVSLSTILRYAQKKTLSTQTAKATA